MTGWMKLIGARASVATAATIVLWLLAPLYGGAATGQPPVGEPNIEAAIERMNVARESIRALVVDAALEPQLANDILAALSEFDAAALELETALVLLRSEIALAQLTRDPGERAAEGAGTTDWPENRSRQRRTGGSTDLEWETARRELTALEAALSEAERALSESDEDAEEDSGSSIVERLTDTEWQAAIARATQYGRPDRTSEGDLDDGSHYEQSSDDRLYREFCDGSPGRPGIVGFNMNIRSNTKSVHWRWKRPGGAPAPGRSWRAFFNTVPLGDLGDRIVRVADTTVTWYQFEPGRERDERAFVLLVACESPGLEELEIHYHH